MSLLSKAYVVSPYQPGKWVVEVNNEHFIVQDNVKVLIDIIAGSTTTQEALVKFNTHFDKNLSLEQFETFFKDTLVKVNLSEGVTEEPIPEEKSFLRLEKVLFSKKVAGKIASVFEFLFIPKVFWVSFVLLSIIAVISIFKMPITGTTKIPILLVMLLYLPTVLLHEIGHVAACKKYTGRSSEIGIGVYVIFPVFFSSISAIWHATKKERIIANLAGIYMQLWCMLIFIGVYLTTGYTLLLHMIFLTGIYNFFQLLPFIRSDGYWLLSDITSIPNLLTNSRDVVQKTILPPYRIPKTIDWQRVFLFAYGSFNFLIIGYFIYYQIGHNWQEIIDFPLVVWNMLVYVVTFQFSKIEFQYSYMAYIVVYVVLFSYLQQGVKYFFKRLFPKT